MSSDRTRPPGPRGSVDALGIDPRTLVGWWKQQHGNRPPVPERPRGPVDAAGLVRRAIVRAKNAEHQALQNAELPAVEHARRELKRLRRSLHELESQD